MRGVTFFCILIILPFLAAAGFDAYLGFNRTDMTIETPFHFSDLGWIWTTYGPESYDWAMKEVDPEIWKAIVAPILRQPAIVVAAVPAGVSYVLLLMLKLLGVWPFAAVRSFSGGQGTGGTFKYKRK